MRSLLLAALAVPSFAAPGIAGTESPSARRVLEQAFDRMFNYPSVRTISLDIQRGDRTATRRSFQVAYQRIGEQGHTLLRFIEPDYLRDDALLVIETRDRGNLIWLYQSESQRTRRLGVDQKADSFYGSDLSFEDLEHHDWDRYELRMLPGRSVAGRDCFVVEAVPRSDSQYSKLVGFVERDRLALLRVDFFRGRDAAPFKSLVLEPGEIETRGDVLVPRRMVMRQNGRDAATEVRVVRVETDLAMTEAAFSAMRLRSGLDLYDLVRRLDSNRPSRGDGE